MSFARFYCPAPLPAAGIFELPPEAAHHAARVLRLRGGDRIELFDGAGHASRGVIEAIEGRRVLVGNIEADDADRESPLRVLLAQALSSSEKMDWVVQKATELGVTEIQPLDTERSVARLTAERAAKRLEHWRQVAIAACEQCGRNTLPETHPPLDIMAWLRRMQDAPQSRFILLPQGAASLHRQPAPRNGVILLIGAEGGFSTAESDSALHSGFVPICLGARVLRTETAAVAGLAALQTLWGDFN